MIPEWEKEADELFGREWRQACPRVLLAACALPLRSGLAPALTREGAVAHPLGDDAATFNPLGALVRARAETQVGNFVPPRRRDGDEAMRPYETSDDFAEFADDLVDLTEEREWAATMAVGFAQVGEKAVTAFQWVGADLARSWMTQAAAHLTSHRLETWRWLSKSLPPFRTLLRRRRPVQPFAKEFLIVNQRADELRELLAEAALDFKVPKAILASRDGRYLLVAP